MFKRLRRILRKRTCQKKQRLQSTRSIQTDQQRSHHNSGFWLLNCPSSTITGPATVVITGLGRSGTSMLAAVLHKARLNLGEQIATGTYEDQQLASLIRQGNKRFLEQWIDQRNQRHKLWGFKLPSSMVLEPSLINNLRQPVLIVIFRDILAIAGRRQVSRGEDLLDQLTLGVRQYEHLLAQLMALNHPTLLVSYEKALLDPESLVDNLDQWLNLELNEFVRKECIASIEASPEIYRREVREPQGWRGRLETVKPNEIAGWAFVCDTQESAELEIWVNGSHRLNYRAQDPRSDVQADHQLTHNRCGFCIQLTTSEMMLQPGDMVSVRVASSQEDLLNSPQSLP